MSPSTICQPARADPPAATTTSKTAKRTSWARTLSLRTLVAPLALSGLTDAGLTPDFSGLGGCRGRIRGAGADAVVERLVDAGDATLQALQPALVVCLQLAHRVDAGADEGELLGDHFHGALKTGAPGAGVGLLFVLGL